MKDVRILSKSDCDEILRIDSERLSGVARLDKTELERLLAIPNEHIAIDGPDGRLVGCRLAFRSDAPYDGEEFLTLAESAAAPLIYVDQVAVDAGIRRAGLASTLNGSHGQASVCTHRPGVISIET